MRKEIKALRKKLPHKGYIPLIIKEVDNNADKQLVTRDVIINFFMGRAVKHESKIAVVKYVNKAIVTLNKKSSSLRKMMAAH